MQIKVHFDNGLWKGSPNIQCLFGNYLSSLPIKKKMYKLLFILFINKSSGNDGLTKEFYEGFWDEIKELFIVSVTEVKNKGD